MSINVGLSCGFAFNMIYIKSFSSGDISGLNEIGVDSRIFLVFSESVLPVKGGKPCTNSYIKIPVDQRSIL